MVTNSPEQPVAEEKAPEPEQLLRLALERPEEVVVKTQFNDSDFNTLYKSLIDDNDGLKTDAKGKLFGTNKVSIIIKPTDLQSKVTLYNLLVILKSVSPDPDNPKDSKQVDVVTKIRQRAAEAFFKGLQNIKIERAKNGKTGETDIKDDIEKAFITSFVKKLYEAEKPEGKLEALGRLIPIISTLRDYSIGKHTVSFDTKVAGEETIKKQLRDAEIGVENEFALMSAFIGTKSQKAATKTALIASAATGLWALVAKLQQNPQTSAMLMAGAAAAGPQALVFAGLFAAVAVSYYVVLKIQDKYAKYFALIRTMNEFMIVLNKIDRLVRLAKVVSDKYSFDVNLREIDAQLQILFKRFDKMLSSDDISKIEKEVQNNPKPDVESGAFAAANSNTDDNNDNQIGGGVVGDMMFKLTFDSEMWNQKLNDDVVKLNLYFTTSMTEFSMILNVIQMGLLTSDAPTDKTAVHDSTLEIAKSTEYRKMVIGILLNDILKLKVDFSFCNRGKGSLFGMTKTTDEVVCLENTGMDPVGNRRSLFRERLHELILHLVEVLNNEKCPYHPDIKTEVKKAVVEPYKEMLKAAATNFGVANKELNKRFYLTENATDSGLEDEKNKMVNDKKLVLKGGWGNVKPSPERDNKIFDYLKQKPYELVSDIDLTKFLVSVNKFVKAASEPSAKEKEIAAIVAKEVAVEVKDTITKVDTTVDTNSSSGNQVSTVTGTGAGTTKGGRLTRKRGFKKRTNRRNTHNKKKSHRSKVNIKAQTVGIKN